MVSLLLGVPGIDVNRADKDGQTPLHWASSRGHLKVATALLGAPGVGVLRKNKEGQSALEVARNQDMVRLLEEVVLVKQTFGALVLALAHCGMPRSEAANLAMHGLRDDGARMMAKRMRDTWPLEMHHPPTKG